MIAALDSSFDAPTLAQAQAARAAGVRAWGGYLATQQQAGAFNLAAPWSRLAFWNVQQAGLRAIAFCSGWDNAGALRQLAAEWNVLLLVDVEDGIRGDGPWVGPFIEASGAGLYGLLEVHHWPAPYRVVAEYPAGGCPDATWSTWPPPAEPHGWQCQGTHRDPVTGRSVDSMRLDDWFGGSPMGIASAASDGDLVALHHLVQFFCFGPVDPSGQQAFVDALRAGTPMNSIMDGWNTLPQSQAWLAAVRNLVADDQALAHLQSAGAPGVDPAQLRDALTKLAADQQAVLADLQADAANPAL